MKTSAFIATLLGAMFATTSVFAAKMLTPAPQLAKAATHIIVGKVRSISFTTHLEAQRAITKYVAEIAIDRVGKGDGLKAGDLVPVRYV